MQIAPDSNCVFVEGLCGMLGGMYAATLRNVISATMGHFPVSNGGTHFLPSRGHPTLLISQMETTLQHESVDGYDHWLMKLSEPLSCLYYLL